MSHQHNSLSQKKSLQEQKDRSSQNNLKSQQQKIGGGYSIDKQQQSKQKDNDSVSSIQQGSSYLFNDDSQQLSIHTYPKPKHIIQQPRHQEYIKVSQDRSIKSEKAPIVRSGKTKTQKNQDSKESELNKGKATHRFKQNEGTNIIFNEKVKKLYRNICQPSGLITLNSLGHALQTNQIPLEGVLQLVNLMQVFGCRSHEQFEEVENEEQFQEQELMEIHRNSAIMREQQFVNFYKANFEATLKKVRQKKTRIQSKE